PPIALDRQQQLQSQAVSSSLTSSSSATPPQSLLLHQQLSSSNSNNNPLKPSTDSMVAQTPDPAFPPVQELSLTVSADIEIHRLWKTITEILSQRFHATRITLCLPQDPTAVSSSIENNLHQSRPWGLKAHWDYKYHFLDENTVTPKDEFAHHHHRLQKSATPSSQDSSPVLHLHHHPHQSPRISLSTLPLPSSSSSSFSSSPSSTSSSSSSFSRRRAAQAHNNRSNNLSNHNSNNPNPSLQFNSNSTNTSTSVNTSTQSGSGNDISIHLRTNNRPVSKEASSNSDHHDHLSHPYDDISSLTATRNNNNNNNRNSKNTNSATNSSNSYNNIRSNNSSSSSRQHVRLEFTAHEVPSSSSSLDYIPDSKDYHGDYWSIHAPLDAGYSSSASTASSYSSSSSSAIKHSRSSNLRAYGVHSNGTECFSNLQSLEYDPEPLLNEHTIDSILRAGKTVVLTREYVGSKASRRRSHKTRPPFLTDDDDDDDSSYTDTDPTTTARRMNGVEIEVGGAVKTHGLRNNASAATSGFENDAGSGMIL
ncbi:hypothetical protein BGZ88_002349, partial [Linnemannia elongata]